MASRQQQFADDVYWSGIEAGLTDTQARLAMAQASLETGFGKSVAGNNMFGIKAGTSWKGPTVNVGTWEEVNGKRVDQNANFRSYSSPWDSFSDWFGVVGSRWGDALKAPTVAEAVQALNAGKPGGYATDSKYGSKLNYIDDKYDPNPLGVMSRDSIPTPAARPDIQFASAAPQAVQRQSLPDIKSPDFYSSVDLKGVSMPDYTRAASPASTARDFDWGRMAAPQIGATTYAATAASTFDPNRFGPAQVSPDRFGQVGYGQATALGRLNTPSPISTVEELMSPAELLAMDVAEANPGRAARMAQTVSAAPQMAQAARTATVAAGTTAPTAAYRDPALRSAYASAQPTRAASPAAGAINTAAPSVGSVGMSTAGLSQAMAQSRAANDRLSERNSTRQKATALGGLLGTVVAGPVGTLLGVGLGSKYANRNALDTDKYPSAPGFGGRLAQLFGYDPGNGGYEGLSSNSIGSVADQFGVGLSSADRAAFGGMSGRDVYNDSGQFRDAVNSGVGGLW